MGCTVVLGTTDESDGPHRQVHLFRLAGLAVVPPEAGRLAGRGGVTTSGGPARTHAKPDESLVTPLVSPGTATSRYPISNIWKSNMTVCNVVRDNTYIGLVLVQ